MSKVAARNMSFHLVCNFKNCLKEIVSSGWATSCSHIFCEEHGAYIKRNWANLKCPACDTVFKDNYSIIETKVNPSNEYKAVALLGIKPSDVLEMATYSIRFWVRQLSEQNIILKEKLSFYRNKVLEIKNDIVASKRGFEQKISKLTKKLEEADYKIKQLNIELIEKNKQLSRIKGATSNLPGSFIESPSATLFFERH